MPLDLDGDFRPGADGLFDLGADEPSNGSVARSLAISTSEIDFGTLLSGETSPIQSITVRNDSPGGASAVRPTYDVDQQGVFWIGLSSCASAVIIPAGGMCTLSLYQQANTAGVFEGSVRVSTDDGESAWVRVRGQAVAPLLSARLSGPVFARVGTSVPAILALLNDGAPQWWRIDALQDVSAPFAASGPCSCGALPRQLLPGQTCSMALAFAPTVPGWVTVPARVADRAGYQNGLPFEVPTALQGDGTSNALGVLPGLVDFGIVLVGNEAPAQEVLVGNGDGVSYDVSLQTPIQAPFVSLGGSTCASSPGVSVAAGSFCRQRIGFTPVGEGVFKQVISIHASNGDTQTLILRGNGSKQADLFANGFE